MKKPIQPNDCRPSEAPTPQRHHKNAAVLLLTILITFLNGLYSNTASAVSPTGVNTRLEGCRLPAGATLPNQNGDFICDDAAYTTGNLGKSWNELDLVPYRLTTSAGNSAPATQTYDLAVVLDNIESGRTGYDVLSAPIVNAGKSHASCAIAVDDPNTATPGIGGTDTSLYRLIKITQAKNTTCVFDYYGRLALGSSQYPGSSLHANLTNENLGTAGIGARDVSIPVKEILPQEIKKDMTATQNAAHTWNITKGPQPAAVDFGDVCAPDQDFEEPVTIRVEWTKLAAVPGGPITIVTNIYANNPAHRIITVNVSDDIRSGTTVLDTVSSGDVDVPANTNDLLLLTHTFIAPAGSSNLNDVATATYTDKVTGIPVPGNTTATASATVQAGSVLDSTALITDVESISGTGLSYSTDGFSGAAGSFQNGYFAGTETTGLVTWLSDEQNNSGFVEFDKTIYLDGKQVTTGTLSDTATLNASNGFTAQASASVNISSTVFGKLTVEKTVPDVLEPGQKLEITLHVSRSGGGYENDIVLTFNAGEFSKSELITALQPGIYTVDETQILFFEVGSNVGVPINTDPQNPRMISDGPKSTELGVQQCEDTVTINNSAPQIEPPDVRVQKITDPLPGALGFDPASDLVWEFTLSGPGIPGGVEIKTVDATADLGNPIYTLFDAPLEHGHYIMTETLKTGWDLISATPPGGSATVCEFDVDLEFPDFVDEDKTFTCIFHNIKRAEAKVIKTILGLAPQSGDPAFQFEIRQGASATDVGTILETGFADFNNGGIIEFTTLLVPNTTYQLCEVIMPGWTTTLGSPQFVVFNPDGDNSTVCTDFTAQPGELKVFEIDNAPPPGGLARTIGFWKNWTSCDGKGNQDPVLDQTLALATPPGIQIGTLFLVGDPLNDEEAPDCLKAIRLLDKSHIVTDKKMASDPAFGLAAQLLAAKFNAIAGAGVCPAAQTAIDSGQALLFSINFNGETHAAMSKTQQNLARTLASTLDSYNNNLLCP
jgi:hypothetical protein